MQTDVADADTFTWLDYSALRFFDEDLPGAGLIRPFSPTSTDFIGNADAQAQRFERSLERLMSTAALHSGEQLIRLGWAWLAGTVDVDGDPTRYCFPMISLPMERRSAADTAARGALSVAGAVLAAASTGASTLRTTESSLTKAGDAEITPLVENGDLRDQLLEQASFGDGRLYDRLDENRRWKAIDPEVFHELPELMTWCSDVATAVGLKVDQTFPLHSGIPTARRKESGISLHMGCGLYIDSSTTASTGTRKSSLVGLSNLSGLEGTAFAKLYGETVPAPTVERDVINLRPLSLRQRRVAGRVGGSDLAAISGAPGTGKSHVLTVVARDAVARGESVLVVAGSPHAVDVLVEHFSDTPGPTPVTFGGSRHGNRLAAELSELISRNEVATGVTGSADDHDRKIDSARRSLQIEAYALQINQDPTYRIETVAEVDRAGDLDELRGEIAKLEDPGWLKIGYKKRASLVKARLGMYDDRGDLEERLEELANKRDALRMLAAGGMTLTPRLDDLASKEEAAAKLRGRLLTDEWISSLGKDEKRTLAQVSSAVTSNRSARRRALAALDPEALTRAAPLWVGSVRDVDEVLPAVPGLFDLVIFDEAAQIDQMNAANGLVRAKRAVVCGDPNQLGHVSYLATDTVEEAAERFGTNAELLNPRAVSTFDAAVAQVPVEVLDEHFRSVPHLIEFSSRRFYGGELHVATRHPANEASDHIRISVVEGSRNKQKVNEVEVEECLRLVAEYISNGSRSIGLISPFRAQADALEEAILDKYRLEEIDAYGLRVGTVHSYQGDERDVLIMSFGVGTEEPDSSWRFVNQKTLFNVMVTRAREDVVVVTSRAEPPGLAGEYVKWAQPLTDLIADLGSTDPWVNRVADALTEQGVPVRLGYPVGRHVIDVVAGVGEHAVAIDCQPHADGAQTHMDRAMTLRRSGWRTADAYQTMWGDNPGQFAIELCSRYPKLRQG